MNNLIKNSRWLPGPNGGPQYFSGVGPITYDNFVIRGNRTCSVTLLPNNCPVSAEDFYDPPIKVCGMKCITWGFTIRAIDSENVNLVAKFYDKNCNLIEISKCQIAPLLTYKFAPISSKFPIPCEAEAVKLSIEFSGRVTACTYYNPTAYFC